MASSISVVTTRKQFGKCDVAHLSQSKHTRGKRPRHAPRKGFLHGLPVTLAIGVAVILIMETFLFIDVIARDGAIVPDEPLASPSGAIEALARWLARNVTPVCWTAVLFVLDGILEWARPVEGGAGHPGSPVRKRPRRFGLCFLASVGIWLSFDAFNFGAIHAWRYHGLAADTIQRLAAYLFAFGAISPALFLMAEAVRRLGLGRLVTQPFRIPTGADLFVIGLGAAFLAFPLFVREPYGVLTLWLGWILLLDPINRRLGAPSLFSDWAAGRWDRTVALMLSGVLCGLLWEFWNYWAVAKWTYDLAFLGPLEQIRYFEMPVVGLAGFPPFALECWVMFQTVVALLERTGLRLVEPLPDDRTTI